MIADLTVEFNAFRIRVFRKCGATLIGVAVYYEEEDHLSLYSNPNLFPSSEVAERLVEHYQQLAEQLRSEES
jgi:hypothetical protein